MIAIEKRNAISDIIYKHLKPESYTVTENAENPAGILVRSANLNEAALPESVLAIARAGAGVNNIPVEACREKGIVVFNTPGANANGVKELVLCAMIAASRNLLPAAAWAQGLLGKEEVPKLVEKGKASFVGPEIKGKTLGVIGLGAIGAQVANDAVALGMQVYGYDPFISVDAAWNLSRGIHKETSLEHLLAESDFVTLHVPLLDNTRETIRKETLSLMKPGAVVLNFSRGELVNNEDILAALEAGKLARYVTDFPCGQLLGCEKVLCIPHLGASTPESEENCADMAAKQLAEFIERGNIINSVNFPACDLPYTGRPRIAVAHKNVANMVGQITGAIAGAGINISDMINKSKKEIAYTLIDLDGAVTPALLNALNAIDGVIRVRAM